MTIGRFEFTETGKTTAYLRLPNHPGELGSARSVPLVDIMGAYDGPYIVFDFDPAGKLVGIEIVGDDVEDADATLRLSLASSASTTVLGRLEPTSD